MIYTQPPHVPTIKLRGTFQRAGELLKRKPVKDNPIRFLNSLGRSPSDDQRYPPWKSSVTHV
jgi:hypothetical protein